ncbi:anti-sigma factor family protein [Achromobacter arsenitoxydans]|uniref:Transmembrane regulator n=1 Tax=Achromobacter arsenitoxydans SY8 TaxID=477184 RepID=H0FE02_9BURK|nr:anti-sigma factor [Achromobacter arsenitoxydans]EHK63524.1 transmembrane regulator [Achromobacter arsenitoxydans SY8]
MNDKHLHPVPIAGTPITEADLHGYADGQLPAARHAEVAAFLAAHPHDQTRVDDWKEQRRALHALLDPVLDEPLPLRLPLKAPARPWPWRALAASVAVAVVSASAAWIARGAMDARHLQAVLATASPDRAAGGYAQRAAIAHAVYAPDMGRPVEVGGDNEKALVTWLTKRMGAPVRAPALSQVGYELMGGRLLPGGAGPVAQFMYGASDGQRLTLYVTREAAGGQTAFQFTQEGPVRVFYWVEGQFGYALSGAVSRDELQRVSQEVYRQLQG